MPALRHFMQLLRVNGLIDLKFATIDILVFEYIESFYNTIHIHSRCNYISPNQFKTVYKKFQNDEGILAS
jgi:hypothetical protein